MLRGFPEDLLFRLRHQPPTALLALLLRRIRSFDEREFYKTAENGNQIWDNLPEGALRFGSKAVRNNFWLFPVLVVSTVLDLYEISNTSLCH